MTIRGSQEMLAGMGLSDEVLEHLFSQVKMGNNPISHRFDGNDVHRRAAQHLLGLMSDRFHLTVGSVNSHNGRFIDNDSPSPSINEGIGGT